MSFIELLPAYLTAMGLITGFVIIGWAISGLVDMDSHPF